MKRFQGSYVRGSYVRVMWAGLKKYKILDILPKKLTINVLFSVTYNLLLAKPSTDHLDGGPLR